ncbi:protein of unknown function DUF4190 [Actinobacteria bacterium OK074]|nr:protein of unknown function DUF4190 [Actinobacteria bacterium OK074]
MSYPQPWQPWQGQNGGGGAPQPWQGQHHPQQSNASMLASTADRERAVDVLRAGFGEGRLQEDELDRRVARAYEARTLGELSLLVADLPQGPVPMTATAQQQQPPVPRTFLAAPPPPNNAKAVGAVVCGALVPFTAGLTGIPAVILGHQARAEIRRTGESGDGFATAGLVLGWLAVAGWALLLLLVMVAAVATSHG